MGLTPIEEKLIALNSCYGFITKYAIEGGRQRLNYPKHIKGHITVFPNNVQELVATVLPHPLIRVLNDIHISWHGMQRPAPTDLSKLLSVRRTNVERALVWLQKNNPHYADIKIDTAELERWEMSESGVPSGVYDRMERNEPSGWDKVYTGHIVPQTERGLEPEESRDIEEVIAMLRGGTETQIDLETDNTDGKTETEEGPFFDGSLAGESNDPDIHLDACELV
jgi:hypothetical protein